MQDRNESCLLSMRAGAFNLFAGSTRGVEVGSIGVPEFA